MSSWSTITRASCSTWQSVACWKWFKLCYSERITTGWKQLTLECKFQQRCVCSLIVENLCSPLTVDKYIKQCTVYGISRGLTNYNNNKCRIYLLSEIILHSAFTLMCSRLLIASLKNAYRPPSYIFTYADRSRVCKAFSSVCLAVCLSVRTISQKRMIPKCLNLVKGMTFGYPTSDMILGSKDQAQKDYRMAGVSSTSSLSQHVEIGDGVV